MIRFRAPATLQLQRAQLTLLLATLIPTILMIAVGIVLLAVGRGTGAIVAGVLVLAFCSTSLTGYILGSIFLRRGATVARFQNDFLSAVSHELRTPLTSLSMFIETLQDERVTDPEEKRKCLAILEREVHRLQGLVERLLDLSRIEAGRYDFRREPVSVDELIEDALGGFEAATLAERVDVERETEPNLTVFGDGATLAQAVTNLLVNAWKYTPAEGRHIKLGVHGRGKDVLISVADNGPGIPRPERRQIFERFERGREAIDSHRPGSGLGLAIVRAVVRAHRGRLELYSTPGLGSEFRIRLRRAQTA